MATITQLQTRILTDISEQANKISYGSPTDTHTSMNTAGIYGVDPQNNWLALECTADGKLKTDASMTATGLATEAKQDTMIGHIDQVEAKLDTLELGKATSALQSTGNGLLGSLDTKIVSCNTGSLATEVTLSSLNGKITACDTSGLATQATLSSLNGKVTACDTSGLATSVLQTSANSTLTSLDTKIVSCDTALLSTEATLSSLNGKVTACDTSALATQATAVSNNTFLASIDTKVATETSLSSLDGKVSQGSAAQLTGAQQVLCYARDSQGNLDALKSDQQGHLEIVISEVDSAVRFKSLDDIPTTTTQQITTPAVGGISTSNTIDAQGKERLSFIGDITDSGAQIQLQGSIDSTTWYVMETYYPSFQNTSPYGYKIDVDKSAVRYFRLSYDSSTGQAETWNIATSLR